MLTSRGGGAASDQVSRDQLVRSFPGVHTRRSFSLVCIGRDVLEQSGIPQCI